LCEYRKHKYFGFFFKHQYEMLSAALRIIKVADYKCSENFEKILTQYLESDYLIDTSYRLFYEHFDRTEKKERYDELRRIVENIYTNKFLGVLLPAWNSVIDIKEQMLGVHSQLKFYNNNIAKAKEKTAVIISDGLRYEVAYALEEQLQLDPNCESRIDYLISTIPAYTGLGMAALLPHRDLIIKDDGRVLVDGKLSDSLDKRETILQSAQNNAKCISYSDVMLVNTVNLREHFKGVDVKYIYHDKIDNRGTNAPDEVFDACSEAINEICRLVDRLRKNANVLHFIITADHGFLYKREKFSESEKIDLKEKKGEIYNRRFIIADEPICSTGIRHLPLVDIIGGDTNKIVSYPIGANVFKTQGGLNYVHGASSPQEMIVPLIKIKAEKGLIETQQATIALVSTVRKITNSITSLDFIQQEPVSDTVEVAEYKIYFLSYDNEIISNEQLLKADKRETDSSRRIVRLKFNFKNKKYDSRQKYWLIVVNRETGAELFRHDVIMDLVFTEDFGFDI
jgi:uncharacterized protein (TIGR02687 family)